LKIEVKPEYHSIFAHKKTGKYIASFGGYYEKGNTKEQAKENLIAALEWYFLDSDFIPMVRDAGNSIYILSRDFWGYTVTRIWKDRPETGQGFSSYNRRSRHDAEKSFKSEVDQWKEQAV
jgi:hypothetical protein